MRRIKFHSAYDLTNGYYLSQIEAFLSKLYESSKENKDVNYFLELYNIKMYFDNEIYMVEWTESKINEYKGKVGKFTPEIMKFFSTIDSNNVSSILNEVDLHYRNDFWKLMDKSKAYDRITNETLTALIENNGYCLIHVLQCKNIVSYFDAILVDCLLKNPNSAEILLNKYEISQRREGIEIYLPKSLTIDYKEEILTNYLNSPKPNLNYVRLIYVIQNNKDRLIVSSNTRLLAKKIIDSLENELFNQNTAIAYDLRVLFNNQQEIEFLFKDEGEYKLYSYSNTWIANNLDYPTLLNNFIHLFGMFDLQMRWSLVSNNNDLSIFEKTLGVDSNNSYKTGIYFNYMNALASMQIIGYREVLNNYGITLEDLFEWFFNIYTKEEFSIDGFHIELPSNNVSILDKCRNTMPEIEWVLKQFTYLVIEGKIDYELIYEDTTLISYKDVPSLIDNKYLYANNSDESRILFYYLFSDQCTLSYIKRLKNKYSCFFDLVVNEDIYRSDYNNQRLEYLDKLEEMDVIKCDENGLISFININSLYVLKDINNNEVSSYWSYTQSTRNEANRLVKEGILRFESTLFSNPESDYLNYILNKSQFNNGLNLRNKYHHSHPHMKSGNEGHEQDYIYFLKILILLVVKINDELSLKEKIAKTTQNET